ncbi:MAG: hypothetical protein A2X46_08415 [Lentisphaerae bacterium GWF2_57_35]|nr:MAG: hypothetical protein A2X46_08415 [Lentisphaerae bacterium GWF2_57_35]
MQKPLIVAHYMTWYQTPDLSGSWGFWQVNRPEIAPEYWHHPDQQTPQGWRDIASVYYPEIGPYDSGDPDLCEYHILLARMSGIDAFVCDWYGFEPSAEHPYDHTGFQALLRTAEKLNFKIGICWEDRSIFQDPVHPPRTRQEALENGRRILQRMAAELFVSPAYLRMDGRPVLMNFAWGEPGDSLEQPWLSAAEWDAILSVAAPRPLFVHDYHTHHRRHDFQGYESVAPWGSCLQGRTDCPEFWPQAEASLNQGRFSFLSGTVRAGFDNRGCGGWGNDLTVDARREGRVYEDTWKNLLRHNVKFIQIATWNDFNEGGTIEPVKSGVLHSSCPAEGYGYRELETTQVQAARLGNPCRSAESLRYPARLYALRKALQSQPDTEARASLAAAADLICALLLQDRLTEAGQQLTQLQDAMPRPEAPGVPSARKPDALSGFENPVKDPLTF